MDRCDIDVRLSQRDFLAIAILIQYDFGKNRARPYTCETLVDLQTYLQHWQPWSFVIGVAVFAKAVDHLPSWQQYVHLHLSATNARIV